MFLSVRWCAEHMTQLSNRKVKVPGQGHVIHSSVCGRSISPASFERFLLNFTQMFLSVRRCEEYKTQLPRLKITGQWIYHGMSCPLHISWTLRAIFIELYQRDYVKSTWPSYLDSRSRSQDKVLWFTLQFVSASYLLKPLNDFLNTLLKCSSQWDSVQSKWPSYLD